MDPNSRGFENFRVPKKKNKEVLELLPSDSEQRKILISKIYDSFKRPEISKSCMKFTRFWTINISEDEKSYCQKRSSMKNSNIKFIEQFGFFYIKSESELKSLVSKGKLGCGNLTKSHLGDPKSAVSLSLHADIYNHEFTKSGILLIVKFIRGRVKYVDFLEDTILDPQPDYECHMIRSNISIDSSTSLYDAFHLTQVYIYEYVDVDIEQYPSHILIYGAVQFTWNGSTLFKEGGHRDFSSINNVNKKKPVKRPNPNIPDVVPQKKIHIVPPSIVKDFPHVVPPLRFVSPPISNKPAAPPSYSTGEVEVITAKLVIGKPPLRGSFANTIGHSLNIKLLSRLSESVMISNIMRQNWHLSEILPSNLLEEYMSLDGKGYMLSVTSISTFPARFNDRKKLGATFRPKYAMYFRLSPAGLADRQCMTRIVSMLKDTNTIGVVRCNGLCNMLFYVFPEGPLSKLTSLPNIDAHENLHGVILTEQHPQFLLLSNEKSSKKEQRYYQDVLTAYELFTSQKNICKPKLSLEVLKRLVISHNMKQKCVIQPIKSVPPLLSPPRSVVVEEQQKPNSNDSDMDVDSNYDNDSDIITAANISKLNGHLASQLPTKANNSVLSVYDTDLRNLTNHKVDNIPLPMLNTISSSNNQEIIRQGIQNPLLQSNRSEPFSSPQQANVSFGTFTLGRPAFSKQLNSRKESRSDRQLNTSRRPIFLDSVIFGRMDGYAHISVYNGEQ